MSLKSPLSLIPPPISPSCVLPVEVLFLASPCGELDDEESDDDEEELDDDVSVLDTGWKLVVFATAAVCV
ncbi:hypothetical protein [Bifidobacterium mongoliense]|uniref:hypothetical protein n=1 Tax=Bifidobacterium mongoliense TaxID=518643 RepID=UPI001FD08290|nr:hypothetical protein [Bifidobacterium mongoliense]MDN6553879.1 hypothetical protein [Bifidobacterium mongoliense]MDN6768720.1 hypothetical protein [Bifidobacterium mongoliense]MDN6783000.1 hypothetical protein [Bifidobacterium mongoliense]MDN6802759.1 hypothetical protein [Bifidobacterium mongoliense]